MLFARDICQKSCTYGEKDALEASAKFLMKFAACYLSPERNHCEDVNMS